MNGKFSSCLLGVIFRKPHAALTVSRKLNSTPCYSELSGVSHKYIITTQNYKLKIHHEISEIAADGAAL
jgi:hypothetical protein